MRLDYWTQISPSPIPLSIGTLCKPTLRRILEIGFDKFSFYEFILKLTPELYYTKLKEDTTYWDSLSEEQKDDLDLFSIIQEDKKIQHSFVDMLNFFFVETVTYNEGYFIFLKEGFASDINIMPEMIQAVLSGDNPEVFMQVLELIQQLCGLYTQEESIDEIKFKNNLAKKLYEKMQKAKKEAEKNKSSDKNMSLANIISSVSNRHPSLNYLNIWDLTVYQLLDSFNRIQVNSMYDIDSTRVSVWGDEKKTFDATLWYKNEYDKN